MRFHYPRYSILATKKFRPSRYGHVLRLSGIRSGSENESNVKTDYATYLPSSAREFIRINIYSATGAIRGGRPWRVGKFMQTRREQSGLRLEIKEHSATARGSMADGLTYFGHATPDTAGETSVVRIGGSRHVRSIPKR